MVIVSISDGKLKGSEIVLNSEYKYYEFLEIPYAKPPIGDLRFKNPQPVEPWGDVRDATSSNGKPSWQTDFFTGKVIGSEDCLYLNVYTPNIADTSQTHLLPVMFHIHGGGFINGTGFKDRFGPEYLIENNVVVVSINYRLGAFGFLNLGIPQASGNMGLKDQVQALKWVQNNIDQFGGDKNNVTIFGISAGGASVEYLMLSPKAKGLYHKAIQQSGSSLNGWAINYDYDRMNKVLFEKLNYQGDVSDKRGGSREIYDFLLKLPAEQFAAAWFKTTESFSHEPMFCGFVPTIEKDFEDAFLTKRPYELLKSGEFNKVPVIKGFCEKEGLCIVKVQPSAANIFTSQKDFVKYLPGKMPDDIEKYNKRFLDVYANDGNDIAIDFLGDLQFSAGVWVSANAVAKHGVPTYVYVFKYDGNLNFGKIFFGYKEKYATHGDDCLYIFPNSLLAIPQPDNTDLLVRSRLTKMWTNFAKTGDPTESDIPLKWPKFTEETKAFLQIDKKLTISTDHDHDRMALFEDIYETGAL